MTLTLGRRWPASAPRGDYAAVCDICHARYPRSELVRRADGLLLCPDDAPGRDAQTLDRLNHERTPRPRLSRHRGGRMDTVPPLLVQSLSETPTAFYSGGERVSSAYEDDLLQIGLEVAGETLTVASAGTDIGYSDTDIVTTSEMLTACGSTAGYCKTLYDQIGAHDLAQTASSNASAHPQAWRKTIQQYIGVGALPLLSFGGSASLTRADACGLSGDTDLTVFVLASGLGQVAAIGGTDAMTGMQIVLEDEDSNDDFGEVVLEFGGGFTVRYETPRWHTLPGRQTGLYAITVRRSAGDGIEDTRVTVDGKELTATAPASLPTTAFALTDTALTLGGSGFTGHVYALGLWDEVLSDADVELLETWANRASARRNDHRGALIGSAQP